MPRKIASVVGLASIALFLVSGCGGSGTDASIRSGDHQATSPRADTGGTVNAAGLRTLTYQGVQFDVPAGWPVYDLTTNPTTCVRFDTHAVYLGHPGANMACPAGIVGRTDTVLVEPNDAKSHDASRNGVTAETASGLQAEVADGGNASAEVDVAFPTAGVSATLTYLDSDATAQQILQSFRAAAK